MDDQAKRGSLTSIIPFVWRKFNLRVAGIGLGSEAASIRADYTPKTMNVESTGVIPSDLKTHRLRFSLKGNRSFQGIRA